MTKIDDLEIDSLPNKPVDDPEVLEVLSPVFVEEFLQLRDLNELVISKLFDKNLPDKPILSADVNKSTYGYNLNVYRVLRSVGYGIYFADNATSPDGTIEFPSQMRVLIISEDNEAVEKVLRSSILGETEGDSYSNLAQLIDGHINSIYTFSLDLTHSHHRDLLDLLGGIPSKEAGVLLQRGFLSSTLSRALRFSNEFGGLNKRGLTSEVAMEGLAMLAEATRLYERLRSEGIKPFSPEEVQGIAASTVRMTLEDNLNIPEPYLKRNEEET